MMRQAIFFSVFLILVGSGIALSGETETVVLPPSEAVVGAEPAAEDSSAIQARHPQKQNNRYAVVKEDARSQIAGVLAEINALEDRGDEPELQREIERITTMARGLVRKKSRALSGSGSMNRGFTP